MASPAYQCANYSVREAASVTLEVDYFSFTTSKVSFKTFSPPTNPLIQFQVSLYPNGYSNAERDHVCIYYRIDQQDRPLLPVQWNTSLINAQGEKQFTKGYFRNYEGVESFNTLFLTQERILMEADTLLHRGRLRVLCEAFILEDLPICRDESPAPISKCLATLLQAGTFSDVILQVAGKDFKSHRAILASRSPVFQAMFENDLKESREGVVKIEEVDLEPFEAFLRYLYTDQVEDLKEIAAELIALADRYQVDSLKTLCGVHLSLEITNDSFTRLLLLSHMHTVDNLKADCLKYFEAHVKEIVNAWDWDQFMEQNLELLPILFKIMTLKH